MQNSPVSWVGGKYRLRGVTIPLFPPHVCYVEGFGGSGTTLFGKEKSKVEVYNDKHDYLVNMFQVFKTKPDEFLQAFDLLPVSRTIFNQFREDYYHPERFTDVEKAVRFYYLIRSSFGSTVPEQGGGCTFGTRTENPSRLNLERLENDIRAAHERIKRVFIENLDFEELIKKYDKEHTLFYLDPPYIESREYSVKFTNDDHERLAACVGKMKGKFVISINPHELSYELYKDYNILTVDHNYSVKRDGRNKECKELIITNFDTSDT